MITRAWLEPGRGNPELGLLAAVADPMWFLARQWELGEFQGEDAASPVRVSLTPEQRPLHYDPAYPGLDPTVIPGEALLEAEPGDWWTLGRRIRVGRAVSPFLAPEHVEALSFERLPAPYEDFAGAVDGWAVFERGLLTNHPIWQELNVPAAAPDRFSRTELSYSARFSAGAVGLVVRDHRGGDIDWFSVDADEPPPAPPPAEFEPTDWEVLPTRLGFPGAPHARWWQIEDAAVDLGGFAPDRSHLATMLLSDLAVANAEDWFVLPVPAGAEPVDGAMPPTSGVLARLGAQVTVTDSFGFEFPLEAPPATGPGAWSLFAVPGLAPTDLVVWPVAVNPHGGPILDDIVIGIDEDANLAWAAELRAEGLEFLADTSTDRAVEQARRTGSRSFRYQPMTTLPDHWYPYKRGELWRQAVLADLSGPTPKPRPGPRSRLIGGPSGDGIGEGHDLAGPAIPSTGIRLRRRARLARDTNGRPVLWIERSVVPVAGPPVSHLRFDLLVEKPLPTAQ